MSKERRLGRGLEALLSKVQPTEQAESGKKSGSLGVEALRDEVARLKETAAASASGNKKSSAKKGRAADSSGMQLTDMEPGPQLQVVSYESHEADEIDADTDANADTKSDTKAKFDAIDTELNAVSDDIAADMAEKVLSQPGLLRVDVRRIDANPHQPRQEFDDAELDQLADSIREHGLLQPIVVREIDGRYQVVAGERRLRAAMRVGWNQVPVHIVEADDRRMIELAIIENVQRKDLNPLEKAASFQSYLQEYGGTQEELAVRLSVDRSTVANLIRLLDLPDEVQDELRSGQITQGHARALLPLADPEVQIEFCALIEREGLNVRQTEASVRDYMRDDAPDEKPQKSAGDDRHLAALEQDFRSALGTKVKLSHNAKGRGKLVIQFGSHEEFERIHSLICSDEA